MCAGYFLNRQHMAASASVLALPFLTGALVMPTLKAQTPSVAGGKPAFEAASVKQNQDPNGPRFFQAQPGGRVNLINQTVRALIYSSYQMQDYQIIGGPDWLNVDRFDVIAKAEGNPPPSQMLLMVRTLLADRFGLAMHKEMRNLRNYDLVMANRDSKPGPQLKTSTCVDGNPNASGQGGPPPCGNSGGSGAITSRGNTMDGLANRLGRLPEIGRPVVNRTGLVGKFDYEVHFTPDQPGTPPPDAISIFAALQEQLGLKLKAGRGPVEVFVIDRVQRPSEN